MVSMKLRAHIGADGILQILTPTDFKDTLVTLDTRLALAATRCGVGLVVVDEETP